MRASTLSAAEQADMDEIQQREQRASGFDLMSVRDRGSAPLSNGVTVYWHHPTRETEPVNGVVSVIKPKVPDNHFGIAVDGKLIEFNAEELMKYLRWA